ncbi:hypothetical protein HK104_010739 [Borealophlyctis nickersoniae]|nr:hypothetical protein HK104_010739 [Borealophlyctis nickersoniae]
MLKKSPHAPLPKPKRPLTKKGAGIAADLKETQERIAEVRTAMETTEKSYKELISIKRIQMQPATVFSNDVPLASFSDTEGIIQELLGRAKDELVRTTSERAKQEEQKASKKLDVAETLANRIARTKERYRAKAQFIKEGPVFRSHFFCSFGDIIHVSMLHERYFIVFSSNNTMEIWEYEKAGGEPHLKELTKLPIDPITMVCPLDQEDITPLSEASTPAEEPATRTESRVGSRIQSARPGGRGSFSGASPSALGGGGASNMRPEPPAAPRGSRGNSGGSIWGGQGGRRMSMRHSTAIGAVLEEDPSIIQARSSEGIHVADEAEPLIAVPADPKLSVTRHSFFLGCSTGVAVVFNVDVTFDPDIDVITHTYQIAQTRKLSLSPIKTACYVELDMVIAVVVSFTGIDHILAAYSLTLEDEWQCRGEVLRITAKDKQMKIVTQMRMDTVRETDGNQIRPFTADESPICALAPDDFHKTILVAMRSGAILRVHCETALISREKDKEKDKDGDDKKEGAAGGAGAGETRRPDNTRRASVMEPAPVFKKDLFISWVLDVQGMSSTNIIGRRDKKDKTAADEKPSYVAKTPAGSKHARFGAATAAPTLYIHEDDKRSDESLSRDVLFEVNPDIPVWADCLKVDGEVSYILAYSGDGLLSLFEIDVPLPLLEMRILADRYTGDANGRPKTGTMAAAVSSRESRFRRVSVLSIEKGIAAITAGREWSVLSVKSLVDREKGDKAEKAEKEAEKPNES